MFRPESPCCLTSQLTLCFCKSDHMEDSGLVTAVKKFLTTGRARVIVLGQGSNLIVKYTVVGLPHATTVPMLRLDDGSRCRGISF